MTQKITVYLFLLLLICSCSFDPQFVGDYAIVDIRENGVLKEGIINVKGDTICKGYLQITRPSDKMPHLFIGRMGSLGYNGLEKYDPFKHDKEYVINARTNKISENHYTDLTYAYIWEPNLNCFTAEFSCDTCKRVGKRYSIINTNGEQVSEWFDDITQFPDRYFIAKDVEGNSAFYDCKGKKLSDSYTKIDKRDEGWFFIKNNPNRKGYIDSTLNEVMSLPCSSIIYDKNLAVYEVFYSNGANKQTYYEIWNDDFTIRRKRFCNGCSSLWYSDKRGVYISYYNEHSPNRMALWNKKFQLIKLIKGKNDLNYSLISNSELIAISTSHRKYAYFKVENDELRQVTKIYDYPFYRWKEKSFSDAFIHDMWNVLEGGERDNYSVQKSGYRIPKFNNGFSEILLNGKYGLINDKAEVIVEPKYDRVLHTGEKVFKLILKGDTSIMKF